MTKKIFVFLVQDNFFFLFFFLPFTNRDGVIRQDRTLNSEKNHAAVFISAVRAEAALSQSKRSPARNVDVMFCLLFFCSFASESLMSAV